MSTNIFGGHVDTSSNGSDGRRRRRMHRPEFKAMVVAACRKPGVSIAAVALDHRLNANLVRRWVVTAERDGAANANEVAAPARAMPAFVPVTMESSAMATSQDIVIELRRGATLIKLSWPLAAASECSAWLRDLLR